MVVKLDKIFSNVMGNSLFNNKSALQTNYTPHSIPHRDKQIEQIASILAPLLRGEKPSNLFLYGKTGTGKTLSVQYVKEEIVKKSMEVGSDINIIYLNCKLRKVADTEYRIVAALIQGLGTEIAATGLPTGEVYSKFIEIINKKKQVIVIILDEIDQAVKKIGTNFLYNLTRLNSELSNAQIGVIGISNDITFLENIDPRVKSSLSEEEIIFPPYNALQLQDILNERCKIAFKTGVVDEGVIAKCSAFAAREHGDARRALDLLRVAGDIAEREGKNKLDLHSIDEANKKIERDKILDIVETSTRQFQMILYSIISLGKQKDMKLIFTGDIYNYYQEFCLKTKTELLTQRRVSDIIAEIDMLGLINAKVISKGRHGRTKEIKLSIPEPLISKVEEIIIASLGL
jgi:cell division control protein 6